MPGQAGVRADVALSPKPGPCSDTTGVSILPSGLQIMTTLSSVLQLSI